jgi:hypothetical protein
MSNDKQNKIVVPNRIRTHHWGVEELMAKMLNKTEEYENDEIEDLEDEFYQEFGIDSNQFQKIVEHLLPYSFISKSPLSGQVLIGFADHNNDMYIIKEAI